MFDFAAPLVHALGRKDTGLANPAQSDTAMASVAGRAIFDEALLAATHARLEELKTVTK